MEGGGRGGGRRWRAPADTPARRAVSRRRCPPGPSPLAAAPGGAACPGREGTAGADGAARGHPPPPPDLLSRSPSKTVPGRAGIPPHRSRPPPRATPPPAATAPLTPAPGLPVPPPQPSQPPPPPLLLLLPPPPPSAFEKLLDIVHSIFKCYMYSFIIENLRLWLDLEGLNFVLLLTGCAQGTASRSTTSVAPRNNWGSHPPDDDLQGAKMSSWSLPPRQGW